MLLTLTISALLLQAPAAQLSVTIENPQSKTGQVLCSLFKEAKGFPGKSPLGFGNVTGKWVGKTAVCEFEAVPAGTWAVTVFHDENGNGKIDENFVGIPTEGYGATNNIIPTLSAPRWEDAKFQLAEGERKALKVTLKY